MSDENSALDISYNIDIILENAKDPAMEGFARASIERLIKKAMVTVMYDLHLEDGGKLLAGAENFGYDVAKDNLREKKTEIAKKYGLTL